VSTQTVLVDVSVLVALAEPNRLRIVELLADGPRTVGEIASALELRQPQVTKHLQTLERAGLVEIRPLGRRRVCALRRPALGQLGRWAAKLAVSSPDDDTLARYSAAVAAADPSPVTVHHTVPADRTAVWRAFTEPALASRWWHPRHFTIERFRLDPRVGGTLELVLREGDGSEHHASGRVHALDPPRLLSFTLDPSDSDGRALFTARHDVRLTTVDGRTEVELTVTPADVRAGAEAALGGLRIGWEQQLDNLAALATQDGLDDSPPHGAHGAATEGTSGTVPRAGRGVFP
jgi:uncharacterized protein YndB with AHSA1/START domain